MILFFLTSGLFLGWSLGHGWLTHLLTLFVNFIILWVGLGIGVFRTVLAAVVVFLLNLLLAAVFSGRNPPFC